MFTEHALTPVTDETHPGYIGVRIVPARNGGHEIKSQGIVMRDERRAG